MSDICSDRERASCEDVIVVMPPRHRWWRGLIVAAALAVVVTSLVMGFYLEDAVPHSELGIVVSGVFLVSLLLLFWVRVRLDFHRQYWCLRGRVLERGRPANLKIPLDEVVSLRVGMPGRQSWWMRILKRMASGKWREKMLFRRQVHVLRLSDGRLFTLQLSDRPNGQLLMSQIRRRCARVMQRAPAPFSEREKRALTSNRTNAVRRLPRKRAPATRP